MILRDCHSVCWCFAFEYCCRQDWRDRESRSNNQRVKQLNIAVDRACNLALCAWTNNIAHVFKYYVELTENFIPVSILQIRMTLQLKLASRLEVKLCEHSTVAQVTRIYLGIRGLT